MKFRKNILLPLLAIVFLMVGCSTATPEPQIITEIVEKEVTVVVEKEVETQVEVEKEVTVVVEKEVEVEVEKEVTVVVEKEVVVEVTAESAEASSEQVMQSDLVFGFASHEAPGDSGFWGIVEKGCKDAAASLGVECKSSGSLDPVEQSQIIETYISDEVDGIIVSLANPEGLRDAVEKAVAAGIPVITMNSGVSVWEDLGALTHVGQSEYPAGQGAGKQFNAVGLTKILCVAHEESNIALEERCDGLEDTFDGEVERFNVASTGTADIAGTGASIQDKLIADDSIDGVLTLNPDVAIAARDAIAAAGSSATLGTFDLSGDVVEAIQAGEIIFGIDQQPYLQGYLPVTMLYLYNTNLNVVGGGNPILTGPGFVTPDNAEAVKALASSGTR